MLNRATVDDRLRPLSSVAPGGSIWVYAPTFSVLLIPSLLLHLFNDLFSRTIWVSWYQKGKTSLDLNEARDDEVLWCSGISCIICKQSAPSSRQITTPTPHHSIFPGQMLFLTPNQQCQSTEGKCLLLVIICKHDVTHKPKVHNISQQWKSSTKPRPYVTRLKTWDKNCT